MVLFWAFIYNIIGIPLAAGVFIPLGLTLNPMFGAAAMSLSSFCVVSNALRLNLFDLHSAKRDHPPKHVPALPAALVQPAAEEDTTQKEETAMKKTLTVEGMMCPHCEARVKKAHGVSMEQQGLKRPKLKGAKSETEREIERRVRRYSQDPEQLSAGKVTKLISNITFDHLNGDIRLNEKKVAGKL